MISLKFPLNISIFSPRPIFKAEINGANTTCMLDTGADMPVFCKGRDLFLEWSKDFKDVAFYKTSTIGGFGKDLEDVEIYNIPSLKISDGKEKITYKNMKMAVMLKPSIPCDLILSAPIFMKMKYTIDCLEDSHFLTVEAAKELYGTGFYADRETIYIFTEETNF